MSRKQSPVWPLYRRLLSLQLNELVGATVRIADGFSAGDDELVFVDQAGISGDYDAASGVLTLALDLSHKILQELAALPPEEGVGLVVLVQRGGELPLLHEVLGAVQHADRTLGEGVVEAGLPDGDRRKVAEPAVDYSRMSPQQLSSKLRQLEAQMYKHAQDLEFEDAARLRDEIHRIREQALVS